MTAPHIAQEAWLRANPELADKQDVWGLLNEIDRLRRRVIGTIAPDFERERDTAERILLALVDEAWWNSTYDYDVGVPSAKGVEVRSMPEGWREQVDAIRKRRKT